MSDFFTWDGTNLKYQGTNLVLSKASGAGIQVDPSGPSWGWRDILGSTYPKGGANAPTVAAFRGGSYRVPFFSAGDKNDALFHLPHDYAEGTDLFLHIHWAHNGTAISGSFVLDYGITYAKGHSQTTFPAETTFTQTISTPDIATIPQYSHRLNEFQISNAAGTAGLLSSALLEPDGLLAVGLTATTIPTITGGATNAPAILTLDIHYQSSNIGTKQKAPSFYT